jgi:hypothetical protein
MLERDLQQQVVEWFKWQYPNALIVASLNAAKRKPHIGALLKKQGMHSGDFDLKLMWGDNQFGHIELKVGDNQLTDKQEEMADFMTQHNMRHAVCWTLEEVQEKVKEWQVK